METKIVFEAPRKSVAQAVAIGLVRFAIGLTIAIAVGYIFLNFTPAGEELKDKYERKCGETRQQLDEGVEFCQAYNLLFGHPPASRKEVLDFQVSRMMHPMTKYCMADGRILPYWNAKDGFGREIEIQTNPGNRTIKLVSHGILPLDGDTPGLFDCVREGKY